MLSKNFKNLLRLSILLLNFTSKKISKYSKKRLKRWRSSWKKRIFQCNRQSRKNNTFRFAVLMRMTIRRENWALPIFQNSSISRRTISKNGLLTPWGTKFLMQRLIKWKKSWSLRPLYSESLIKISGRRFRLRSSLGRRDSSDWKKFFRCNLKTRLLKRNDL